MQRRPHTDEAGAAFQGSQQQIQLYVNKHSDEFSHEVIAAIASDPRDAQMHWVSPLENDLSVSNFNLGSRWGVK